MAAWIRQGHKFYVAGPYGAVYLEAHGTYLTGSWVKTSPNGYHDDNLYALPKF